MFYCTCGHVMVARTSAQAHFDIPEHKPKRRSNSETKVMTDKERRALTDLVRAQRDPSKSEEERRALLDMFYSGKQHQHD